MNRRCSAVVLIHSCHIVSPVAVEVSGGEAVADIVQVVSRAEARRATVKTKAAAVRKNENMFFIFLHPFNWLSPRFSSFLSAGFRLEVLKNISLIFTIQAYYR